MLFITSGVFGAIPLFTLAEDKPYEVVSKGILLPGNPIPSPTDRVILTIHGAKAKGNAGGKLEFDLKTLESIGLVRFSSKNQWYDAPVTYEGVLGSKFLTVVGVPGSAKTLRLRALNDYVVYVPLADLRKWPVILATKLNGKHMSVRGKGPL